jgi:uncharacterized protein involved in oxidation of intracellular sulfur
LRRWKASACAYFSSAKEPPARTRQKVPQGHYNIEVMLKTVSKYGGEIGVCSSCMDARGIQDAELVEGTRRSSMDQLTAWTREADKVLVF